MDENGAPISKSAVADWIMENYYNDENLCILPQKGQGKILENSEQLYQYNEEYRKSVDKEIVSGSAVNDEEYTNGFMYNDKMIVLENGNIQVIASEAELWSMQHWNHFQESRVVFSVIKI